MGTHPRPVAASLFLLLFLAGCNGCSGAGSHAVVDPDFKARVLALAKSDNQCPEGKEILSGKWRFSGETRAPGFRDEMVFRGAEFTEFLASEGRGRLEQAIVRGRYACIEGGRLVFYVDRVDPEGGFDNRSGDVFVCTLLFKATLSFNDLALLCHFDWNPRRTTDFTYTRSGR